MKRFGMCLTFHLSVSSVTSLGLISGKPVLTITQNEQHEAIKQAVNETLPSYI